MWIVPNSWGSPKLREFNSCHDDLGRFCSTQAVGSHGSQLVLAERPAITTGVSRVDKARRAIKGEMRPVTGAEEKRARKKFAIPPMYTNVMVTDDPNSEVRATAYSPNTGKTVPYHSKAFKSRRESQKWSRVANIAKDIGKLVERVNRDSGKGGASLVAAQDLSLWYGKPRRELAWSLARLGNGRLGAMFFRCATNERVKAPKGRGWSAYSTTNPFGGSSRWGVHRPHSAWLMQHLWEH